MCTQVLVHRAEDGPQSNALIELRQDWTSGKTRKRMLPLAEKLKGDEDPLDGAVRGILEEIGEVLEGSIVPEKKQQIELKKETLQDRREEKDSPSYPGLRACKWSRASKLSLPSFDKWREVLTRLLCCHRRFPKISGSRAHQRFAKNGVHHRGI